MDVVRAEAEDAGRASDAVVDVGVGDHHGRGPATGEPRGPGVAERDVAGGEQGREIRQRAAGGDQAAERAGCEAKLLAHCGDHRVFDRGGERAHLVNRHRLIRHAAHEVEQRGERHRRRNLVADVMRMMQILAAGEALLEPASLTRSATSHGCAAVSQRAAPASRTKSAGWFQLSALASRDSTRRR